MEPANGSRRPLWIADLFFLLLPFAMLGFGSGRPLLDNYVGRQIPTAMVARNLERGSGFLRPQLDTGPFPNLFLVEPPIYVGLAASLQSITGWDLGRSGRLVSILGTGLAAWGIFGLGLRRSGVPLLDQLTPILFLLLPITQRFGLAFQPDMLAIGLVLAGLRLWDAHESGTDRGRWRLVLAWSFLASGFATRILTAYALAPLIIVILRPPRPAKITLALSTLIPAVAWYAYAASVVRHGTGSNASADNAALWFRAVSFGPWLDPRTYRTIAYMIGWRAFSPFGFALAASSLLLPLPLDRFWKVWGVSAVGALLLTAGKLHHEYYFLALAPVASVLIWRGTAALKLRLGGPIERWIVRRDASTRTAPSGMRSWTVGHAEFLPRTPAYLLLLAIPLWSAWAVPRTDQIPKEWAAWPLAVSAIRENVPQKDWISSPEAILYLADRRGCRLEYEPKARLRAAGEWGVTIDLADPLALVEFYRSKGATFVCDLWPVSNEPDRRALHDAIRRRYNVVMDRDGVILAELVDRE